MNALPYILVTSMKNRLLQLKEKPGKLILYLICFAFILLMVIQPGASNPGQREYYDLVWLKAAYFAFMVMFFYFAVQKGLSNGDTIFEMQDVNFLFVSPVSPQSILLYGLVQMAKMAFWAGFFLLFQGGTLSNLFGVGVEGIFILFLNFIVSIVVMSILSLVIYNLTNGRPGRKRLVKVLAAAVFLPLVVYGGWQWMQIGEPMRVLENVLRSPVLSLTPFVGWSSEAAVSMIMGGFVRGILFVGISLFSGGLLLSYILLGKIDYYEDVLVATETSFERKRAIAEGQVNPESAPGRRTRVAATGVGGNGASVFLFKHLRETMRSNALGLLTWPTVFMILGMAVLGWSMRDSDGAIITVLQIMMWIQVFMIGMGRGIRELMTHYIYLIPESSFRKIVWSNLEPVVKVLLESLLLFGICGVIGRENPLVILGCIAVFSLFSMMLIGINYLSMRWFGAELSDGILIAIYFFTVIVLLLPGLIAAIVAGFTIGGVLGIMVGLAILAVWELIVAVVSFALSGSVLHNCDIQVRTK